MIKHPFPWGGLTAAIVIIAGEMIFLATTQPLSGRPYFQPTSDDATVEAKRSLLPRAKDAVVLIGDSSCMMGLLPDRIQTTSGLETVNLGMLITLTNAGFCELAEAALRQSPPPKAIVLAVLPHTMGQDQEKAIEFGILGRTLVAYQETCSVYSPSLYDRRAWFFAKHRLNRFPDIYGGSYEAYQALLQKQGGFLEERRTYRGGKVLRQKFVSDEFSLQPVRDLAAQAAKQKVPMYVWWSPSPRDALSEECLQSVQSYHQEVARALPGVELLQSEVPVWDPKHFGSPNHLTLSGAEENSDQLARKLKELLAN